MFKEYETKGYDLGLHYMFGGMMFGIFIGTMSYFLLYQLIPEISLRDKITIIAGILGMVYWWLHLYTTSHKIPNDIMESK